MSKVDGMINEDQWSGDAADTFHRQFLFPFHTATQRQRFYLRELHIAMQSYHDAISHGIDDVNKIIDSCNASLAGNHDGTTGDAFFTVVGIVSDVVSIFATGPVGLGADLVGLFTGAYSGLAIEAEHPNDVLPPELRVYGANAPQIIQSTWDAVVTLEGLIADVDDQLNRGLNNDLDSVIGFGSPGLTLGRPDLADHDQSEDPWKLQILSAPGVPMSENPVVASIVVSLLVSRHGAS